MLSCCPLSSVIISSFVVNAFSVSTISNKIVIDVSSGCEYSKFSIVGFNFSISIWTLLFCVISNSTELFKYTFSVFISFTPLVSNLSYYCATDHFAADN